MNELVPFLFRCCRGQAKGVFASIISRLTLRELTYCQQIQALAKPTTNLDMQIQAQRQFVAFKILTLIVFSRIDLNSIALKTENRELQMDVVIMRLEESLEIKLAPQELALFKKEFESFFLVPLKVIESKMLLYLGFTNASYSISSNDEAKNLSTYFEISLIVLLNRVLEEWERF